jgi:hypothetical protein
MARCYQCGSQTAAQVDGSAVCLGCQDKLSPGSPTSTVAELNDRVNFARDAYQAAVRLQLETFRTVPAPDAAGDPTAARHEVNLQIELASVRYRQALRELATALLHRPI